MESQQETEEEDGDASLSPPFDIQKRRKEMMEHVKYYKRFEAPLTRGRKRARRSDPDRKRPASFYRVQPTSWVDFYESWLGPSHGLATRECWECRKIYQAQTPWSNKERHCTPCYYNLFIQRDS